MTEEQYSRFGHPRLIVASHGSALAGSPQADGNPREFAIDVDRLTIGSDTAQNVCLGGLYPRHAEVQRDGEDFIFVPVTPDVASRVAGALTAATALHHGDRIDLGDWTLIFQRDEREDHLPTS